MNRILLTIAFTITALVLSANESSAFFHKKKACHTTVPVVTYAAPNCCGSTQYGGNMSYSMPYHSNMGYGMTNYGQSGYSMPYNNMGYGTMNSPGVLGTVSNLGTTVIDATGNIITLPFRMIR